MPPEPLPLLEILIQEPFAEWGTLARGYAEHCGAADRFVGCHAIDFVPLLN